MFSLFISFKWLFYVKLILCILLVVIFLCCLWYLALNNCFNVQIGEPPFKDLCIAYKYIYRSRSLTFSFKQLNKFYPNYKMIKLCYTDLKASHVEYASGIIVSDVGQNPDAFMLEHLLKTGLSVFKTPYISHALFVSFPITKWIPISKIIAVAVAYPKLFDYAKAFSMCAYPVMEIYSNNLLTVIVPLIRQDEFVVREAERLIYGQNHSAMLRPLSTFSYLPLTLKKKSKVNSATKFVKDKRKG